MKKLIVLAAAVGFVLTTALPALAWNFNVSADCRVLEEQGVYIVTFTIDNTSEPEELTIIDQDPASGITSVPAGSTASWSLAVPINNGAAGASWEVLANWPSDQRPRHRVASVRFDQKCPYEPPPTTTTTEPPPPETTTTTEPPPPETTTTTLAPAVRLEKRCDTNTDKIVIDRYENDILVSTTITDEDCGRPDLPPPITSPSTTSPPLTELPFTGPEEASENARAALPYGIAAVALGFLLLGGSWAYGKIRSQRRHR